MQMARSVRVVYLVNYSFLISIIYFLLACGCECVARTSRELRNRDPTRVEENTDCNYSAPTTTAAAAVAVALIYFPYVLFFVFCSARTRTRQPTRRH